MISAVLQRRLTRLENVLLPKPRRRISIFCEPADDAPAEDWAAYGAQVDETRARGASLMLLAPMLPSRRGNKSLLSDVLEDLPGNVFEPKPQAGDYAPGHLQSKSDQQDNM